MIQLASMLKNHMKKLKQQKVMHSQWMRMITHLKTTMMKSWMPPLSVALAKLWTSKCLIIHKDTPIYQVCENDEQINKNCNYENLEPTSNSFEDIEEQMNQPIPIEPPDLNDSLGENTQCRSCGGPMGYFFLVIVFVYIFMGLVLQAYVFFL